MSDREALGLEDGHVIVVPYDARWPRLFDATASELRRALGGAALEIHHVGSTAVVGLAAKPILDILVTIPDFQLGRSMADLLAGAGYEYRPDEDIPDRHFFRRHRGTARTHHVSLAEPDSTHVVATLRFRDALREDAALAGQYERLKLTLAERCPHDRRAYIEGKSDFVRAVLARKGLPARA